MPIHHVALATKDTLATHRFYSEAMGFTLAKVVAGESPGGWSKHLFYDTGDGGFIAFWELHDDSVPEVRTEISTGLGLPIWVNHLAFAATSQEDFAAAKQRWLDHGVTVIQTDHGWCESIYAIDPNGVLVEWCVMTRELDEADAAEALRLLADPEPPLEPQVATTITQPTRSAPTLVGG